MSVELNKAIEWLYKAWGLVSEYQKAWHCAGPGHKGGGAPIISLLPLALLGFLYSNCGFLSPFLLHCTSQKIFQNSSHNYCGTTVNSLQFLRAQHRLVLKTAVYRPLTIQLWCDRIWRHNLWGKCLDFKTKPSFVWQPEREWKPVFLQTMSEALRLGAYLPRTANLSKPTQGKISIVRIPQEARGRVYGLPILVQDPGYF